MEITDRGVAGAEVVQGHADPALAQLLQGSRRPAGRTGEDGFGHLEDKVEWLDSGSDEDVVDLSREARLVELAHRHIDRERQAREAVAPLPVRELCRCRFEYPRPDRKNGTRVLSDVDEG